jgi:hypothetical protein
MTPCRKSLTTLAVVGALMRRDLLRSLRTFRAFLLLVVAVAILSFIVFAGWPEEFHTLSMIARTSEELLMIFASFYFVAACIVLPAYGAAAIVQEREQNTLDMLDLTLTPRWALLIGKLLNTLGFYLLLLVAGLPPMSLLFGLVGLDLAVLGKTLVILLPTALSVAMVSLLCSIRARRSIIAFILSFLGMLCVMGVWLIPVSLAVGVLTSWDPGLEDLFLEIFPVLSPVVALVFVSSAFGSSSSFLYCAFYQTALFAFIFLAAWRMLRRPFEAGTPRRSRSRRRPLRRLLDVLFVRVPPFKPIADRANPMYRSEVQWSLLTRPAGRRSLFLFLSLFFVAVLLLFDFMFASDDGVMSWAMAHLALICLLSPIMSANTLTKESELGNLDMLRVTLLRPRDIVWGKTHAAFTGVCSVLAVTFLSSLLALPLVWDISRGPEILLVGFVTVVVCASLLVCFGILASAVVKRSTTAVVLGYASSLVYIFLLLPAWWGAMEIARDIDREFGVRVFPGTGNRVAEVLQGLSPVHAFWELLDGTGHGPYAYLMAQWVISMAANGLLCFLLVTLAAWLFGRLRMKEK